MCTCTALHWTDTLTLFVISPSLATPPPPRGGGRFESVSYESGISCSPNSPQISCTDFCFMTHSYAFLAPLDALASACSFPVTPTCDSNCSGGSHISEELNEGNSENWPKRCRYS